MYSLFFIFLKIVCFAKAVFFFFFLRNLYMAVCMCDLGEGS